MDVVPVPVDGTKRLTADGRNLKPSRPSSGFR